MITLSEAVLDELKRLRGRTERTFRIEPGCSCCHSPTLELILDEPEDDDVTTEVSGFTFCIRKRMLDQLGNVIIFASFYNVPLAKSHTACISSSRAALSFSRATVWKLHDGFPIVPRRVGCACL